MVICLEVTDTKAKINFRGGGATRIGATNNSNDWIQAFIKEAHQAKLTSAEVIARSLELFQEALVSIEPPGQVNWHLRSDFVAGSLNSSQPVAEASAKSDADAEISVIEVPSEHREAVEKFATLLAADPVKAALALGGLEMQIKLKGPLAGVLGKQPPKKKGSTVDADSVHRAKAEGY